ncbi:MAG: Gfo/Idh/MocA family oxidoreductase [Solirubrobacterales bacterium]|nr:Gfo/Idh/MocA family oxidoreductase [Solirubrobacterales bacterium]
MLTLWHGVWLRTPRPHPVPGAAEIRVTATAPIVPFGEAHGREFGSPLRKVASFTLTDGPAATLRKARSKRAEDAYTGDYCLALVLGDVGERRVLALAPRAPRCAGWMLAPASLVRDAPAGAAGEELLGAAAARLRADAASLGALARQSHLYSGMEPPAELAAALDAALGAPAAGNPATEATPEATERVIHPPAGAGDGEETLPLPTTGTAPPAAPPLAILGAGDYVRIEVVPALGDAALRRAVIADREPQIAALAAERLAFAAATTDARAAVDALPERGLVVVATAHDSHAELAAHALDGGHRVFCEKPAVVTPADLELLAAAAERNPGELEVGFNRRWNPIVERARRELATASGPLTIVATIREVDITPDHWYLWPNQGTRVAGNLCHWIDLAVHLLGAGPQPVEVAVSPRVSDAPTGFDAERTFSVTFDDGSAVTLLPTGRGDSVRGVQEQVEVRRGSLTLTIDDLWKLRGLRAGRPLHRRTLWRDKGHARMYASALARFEAGEPAAYPLEDLRRSSEIQLAATELVRSGAPAGGVAELIAR